MEKNIYAISYKMRRELYHKIFSVAGIILIFFVLVSLFMTFIIFPVANKSDSMSPDIPAGSYEFVSPLLKNPERGDVILLQNYKVGKMSPFKRILRTISLFVTVNKWQPFEENPVSGTRPVLRRVVGLPGDTIYIDRYVVFIKPAGQSHWSRRLCGILIWVRVLQFLRLRLAMTNILSSVMTVFLLQIHAFGGP